MLHFLFMFCISVPELAISFSTQIVQCSLGFSDMLSLNIPKWLIGTLQKIDHKVQNACGAVLSKMTWYDHKYTILESIFYKPEWFFWVS